MNILTTQLSEKWNQHNDDNDKEEEDDDKDNVDDNGND